MRADDRVDLRLGVDAIASEAFVQEPEREVAGAALVQPVCETAPAVHVLGIGFTTAAGVALVLPFVPGEPLPRVALFAAGGDVASVFQIMMLPDHGAYRGMSGEHEIPADAVSADLGRGSWQEPASADAI